MLKVTKIPTQKGEHSCKCTELSLLYNEEGIVYRRPKWNLITHIIKFLKNHTKRMNQLEAWLNIYFFIDFTFWFMKTNCCRCFYTIDLWPFGQSLFRKVKRVCIFTFWLALIKWALFSIHSKFPLPDSYLTDPSCDQTRKGRA